jgi:biotin carboxyl carrier protein
MPGLILRFEKNIGDEIKKGDSVLILEAMKMENILKSPGDGIVKNILVKQGQAVEKNQILIELE